jgi:hypothetical protein
MGQAEGQFNTTNTPCKPMGWRARDRQPMTTARNTQIHSAHARPLNTARPLTRHSSLGSGIATVESEYVGKPTCEKCGTDEFIYLESYVPPVFRRDGGVKTLGEVAYTCTRCEDFSAHSVPMSWAPPGWYLG